MNFGRWTGNAEKRKARPTAAAWSVDDILRNYVPVAPALALLDGDVHRLQVPYIYNTVLSSKYKHSKIIIVQILNDLVTAIC